MVPPINLMIVKGLVKPIRDQNAAMEACMCVSNRLPKFQSYTFDLTKASEIFDEMLKARIIE